MDEDYGWGKIEIRHNNYAMKALSKSWFSFSLDETTFSLKKEKKKKKGVSHRKKLHGIITEGGGNTHKEDIAILMVSHYSQAVSFLCF